MWRPNNICMGTGSVCLMVNTSCLLVVLSALALSEACQILLTRFNPTNRRAYVFYEGGKLVQDPEPCSLALAQKVLKAKLTTDPLVVYHTSTDNFMVVVDTAIYNDAARDSGLWYEMPWNDATAMELTLPKEILAFGENGKKETVPRSDLDAEGNQLYDVNGNKKKKGTVRSKPRILSDSQLKAGDNFDLLTPPAELTEYIKDNARQAGIPNVHGISCYMNTAIQLLHSIPEFRHKLADLVVAGNLGHGTLSSLVNSVFGHLERGETPSSDLMKLVIKKLAEGNYDKYGGNGGGYIMAESFEALITIVETIEAEAQAIYPLGSPPVFRDLLYTWEARSDKLLNLDFATVKRETKNSTNSIGFKIETIQVTRETGMYETDGTPTMVRKTDEFTFDAILPEYLDTKMYGIHQIERDIKSLPPYFFASVPRLDERGNRITNSFSFPLIFSTTDYPNLQQFDSTYELIGYGHHVGLHYTTYSKGQDGKWACLNDPRRREEEDPADPNISSKNIVYVLYRRLGYDEKVVNLPNRPGVPEHVNIKASARIPARNNSSTGGSNNSGSNNSGCNSIGGGVGSGGGNKNSGSGSGNDAAPKPANPPTATVPTGRRRSSGFSTRSFSLSGLALSISAIIIVMALV